MDEYYCQKFDYLKSVPQTKDFEDIDILLLKLSFEFMKFYINCINTVVFSSIKFHWHRTFGFRQRS